MFYGCFDSNVNLYLHFKQMMRGKAVQWDSPGDLSAHADMDDFMDVPMPFPFVMPPDRGFDSGSGILSVKD
jgi:hypothetical protein